jgi:glutamine synthetase
VYSERELHSRQEILLENYATTISIEAETASMMAHTMILPAGLKYQADVAAAVNNAKAAGVEDAAQLALLEEIVATNGAFRQAAVDLDAAKGVEAPEDAMACAKYQHDTIIPAMEKLRGLGDKLEMLVDTNYWPLPTYGEMLFIR